ncbi:MAG: hypothetical protein JSV68_07990 [Anaerolineaceae bacterium]|nr:MAG: hypothetical protein JSV68_07990 [Anaerolineaceae bacterium]
MEGKSGALVLPLDAMWAVIRARCESAPDLPYGVIVLSVLADLLEAQQPDMKGEE